MNLSLIFVKLLVVSTFICSAFCASASPTWNPHPAFRAGTFSLLNPTGTPYSYTGTNTYASSLSTVPRYVAIGISGYRYIYANAGDNYNLTITYVQGSSTSFDFKITASRGTDITYLYMTYLTVEQWPNFPFTLAFYDKNVSIVGTTVYTDYVNYTALTSGQVFNVSSNNIFHYFFHRADFRSINQCQSLIPSFSVFNQSFFRVILRSNCTSSVQIAGFGYSLVIFDRDYISRSGECKIVYGNFQDVNSNSNFLFASLPSLNNYDSNCFLFGLAKFYWQDESNAQFSTQYNLTQVRIINIDTFELIGFNYMMIKKRGCASSHLYFYPTDQLCYDVCPSGHYPNTTTNLCVPCTNNITCIDCPTGYYPFNNTSCVLCRNRIRNCSVCTYSSVTQAVCQTCDSSYLLSTNGLQCSKCGDAFTTSNQQCDDGNHVDGDGCNADCTFGNNNGCPASSPYRHPLTNLCTSTCPDGYYPNVTLYTCPSCYYTCATCSSNTGCLSCSSASHRTLNGTQCLPNPGYFENGTHNATACVAPCATCLSATLCESCVIGYYYFATYACNPCSSSIPFCLHCDPVTGLNCSLCLPGYILNASNNACNVVPCADANCVDCSSSFTYCDVCAVGYFSNNGVCSLVCGDRLILGNEECDDGNTVEKDGCSLQCKVETDFLCEQNATIGLGSFCYFIGEAKMEIVYIHKIDGQNKVEALIKLTPNDLAIWNEVNFLEVVTPQFKCPVTAESASRNSDGNVIVTFAYGCTLQ